MKSALAANVVPESDMEHEAWLSALLDGEQDDDEVMRSIERVGKETSSARRWREYCLIGDAMRGCMMADDSLESRIKAALAAEPTVLAPVPKGHHHPAYWAAAAMAVVAITWTVLSVAPVGQNNNKGVPVAVNAVPTQPKPAGNVRDVAQNDVSPYLAAHQDYAFAVVGEPDMNITPVSLNEGSR
jgi:sigma-E factor negative regulatory protein RseA